MICSLCWTKPEMSKLIEAHTIEDKPVVICHECVEIFQDILRDAGVSTEGKYLQGYRRDGEQLAAQWEDQAEGLTRNSNEGQVAGGLLYRECAKQLRAILPREPFIFSPSTRRYGSKFVRALLPPSLRASNG